MSRKKNRKYQGGRIKKLVEKAAWLIATDEKLAYDARNEDFDRLHHMLAHAFEGYGKQGECFNCSAKMEIIEHTAGLFEALLLLRMAEQVRKNLEAGMPFTQANLIHIPTLDTTDAIRHRVTIASYLNLVKQPEDAKNSGYWLITQWGWKALRGESVPKTVQYFRRKLIGRGEEVTTLPEMFRTHREQVEAAIANRKNVRSDHRSETRDYNPRDWFEVAGYAGAEDEI